MKLIIAGTRSFTDEKMFWKIVHDYHRKVEEYWLYEGYGSTKITEIVSGGAKGVDRFAEEWATEQGLELKIFKPIYDDAMWPSKLAPLHRNAQMAEYGDALLALWDGLSGGTANMIANMCLRNKPVFVVKI